MSGNATVNTSRKTRFAVVVNIAVHSKNQMVTVTGSLKLPWNRVEPRYWALNVKLPCAKNCTVNVAVATPLTTRTFAVPRIEPLYSSSTVPSGAAEPDPGAMVTVKV